MLRKCYTVREKEARTALALLRIFVNEHYGVVSTKGRMLLWMIGSIERMVLNQPYTSIRFCITAGNWAKKFYNEAPETTESDVMR